MRFPDRPQPWQSSRFWFLILTGAVVTAFWKFGLFPEHFEEGQTADELTEIELRIDGEATASTSFRTSEGSRSAVLDIPSAGHDSSVAMTEPFMPPADWSAEGIASADSTERPLHQTGRRSEGRSNWWLTEAIGEPGRPAANSADADPVDHASELSRRPPESSPFGPARPEFVGIPQEESRLSGDDLLSSNSELFPEWRTSPSEVQPRAEEAAPPSLDQPSIIPASAQVATSEERTSAQRPSLYTGPSSYSAGPADFDFTRIDQLLEQGDDVGAHRELSTLYWGHPELRPQLMDRIQVTAERIYFQAQPHYMEPYVVQPGDTLQSIARRYDISWQYLAKLNRVEPTRIRPGQQLKVIRGPFAAVVDLSDFEITIHAHGYFVCRFPVGIGKDNSTPTGRFVVDDKLVDPTYYGPEGVIAHDDPNNPLGEYWISIGDSYGIHGTIDPDSIGKAESRGCVRLRDEDIAEVYDFLTVGSEVVIRP